MNHMGTREIVTDRLLLREFKESDYKNMYKNWASDDRVSKYVLWDTHKSEDVTKERINNWVSKYENPSVYNWAIELKEINEVIGNISVVRGDDNKFSCEIGYCIGSSFWNKGFTTEAFNAVIEFLFKEVGFHRIYAQHDLKNKASGEVMKKCNMKHEGTLRDAGFRNDSFYSLALYAIINE